MASQRRSFAAAITLFFVAPLVAEFLLGNLPFTSLGALIVLAPMYGGGAILIRETTRRAHRGWPSMLLLGCAYTLIEEGFVDQSLFNPDYLGMHLHLLDPAWIPTLGIGAWWTLFMFNLHTFWSTATSIALVEALVPSRARTPWLGRIGLSIFALLFLAGLAGVTAFTLKKDHFLASPAQFASTALACIAFIVLAFRVPASRATLAKSQPPKPWITGAAALILGLSILFIPPAWNWGAVAAMAAVDLVFLFALAILSARPGWTPIHTLSIAAGAALAYGAHAFVETPVIGASAVIVRVGNAIFLAIALAIIAIAARRTTQSLAFSPPVPTPLVP